MILVINYFHMRACLQSYTNYGHYIWLDDTTEVVSEVEAGCLNPQGWYHNDGLILSAIFVDEGRVLLRIGDARYMLDNSHTGRILEKGSRYEFELMHFGSVVDKFIYKHNHYRSIYDISAFTEDEDFNWGLFLCNIINDENRRRSLIKRNLVE